MDAPDIRVYLGRSGSGKTTLARHQVNATTSRVLIFDLNGEAGHAAGAHVVTDRRQLLELVIRPGPIAVCWRGAIGAKDPDQVFAAFDWANQCAMAAGNLAIFWDEVDRWSNGRLQGTAYAIVNSGRHRNLRVFATSRRPARVPRDLTALATRICAFSTTEPRDLDFIEDYMGAVARQLPSLPKHHAIDWTEAGATARPSPFA